MPKRSGKIEGLPEIVAGKDSSPEIPSYTQAQSCRRKILDLGKKVSKLIAEERELRSTLNSIVQSCSHAYGPVRLGKSVNTVIAECTKCGTEMEQRVSIEPLNGAKLARKGK